MAVSATRQIFTLLASYLTDLGLGELATVNAAGTGTTANRTASVASGANSGWDLNAPGQTLWGTAQFDTIGLAIGQAPAALGTGKYCIALEGAVV